MQFGGVKVVSETFSQITQINLYKLNDNKKQQHSKKCFRSTLTSALASRRHSAQRAAAAVTQPGGAATHATMIVVCRLAAVRDAEKSVESVDRSVGHLRRDRSTPVYVQSEIELCMVRV